MNGIQNVLKDVDLQIVYRRMEARKKNITADGQMTKRQQATAYRGYHGLESQYHALQRMSNDAMIKAQHKNDQLQNRHVDEMKSLIEQETMVKGQSDKDLKSMRENFTAQLAYQYVYKNHSFKRFYNSQKQKKPRPVSDKPEMYERERVRSGKNTGPRPLGSLRQTKSITDELKLPPINNPESNDGMSPRVNMMGGKTYQTLQEETKDNASADAKITGFPNIESAMGVEIKYKYTPEDDKDSLMSAPPAGLDAEPNNLPSSQQLRTLDMAQNLLIMKRKEQERFEMQRRTLPKTPAGKQPTLKPSDKPKEGWRRILPETPSRPSSVFPDTARTPIGLKKKIKEEVSDVMDTWLTISQRNEIVEHIKELNKADLADHPIPVVDRNRPMSAILREYREYKKQQELRLKKSEQKQNDQTVIVRQISPQVRPESPVMQRQNNYITRVMTPMQNKRRDAARNLGPKAGSLHKTDSEKFPSVSRTSSYKELPEAEMLKFQENATMTAAERIELEKKKRQNIPEKENRSVKQSGAQETKGTGKRQLPSTPCLVSRKKLPAQFETKMPPKMFNTSILAVNDDFATIDKVQLANSSPDPMGPDPMGANSEHNSYMPVIKHRGKSATGKTVYSPESLQRMKTASALYDNGLWSKLEKRMEINYDHFTRVPPDKNKHLEMRAKNRRKIQAKNAQLAMEKRKKKIESESVADTDRPSTRVSFNENVIVFQTI